MPPEIRNFIDFISLASADTRVLNEFLAMCTVRELQTFLEELGVKNIPNEQELKKIIVAKNDLLDLINTEDSGVDKY